jgi:acyl-CoA synthetase (AMP-forming)/AMP-acid ligase II
MNLSEWLMRSATRSPLAPALLTGTHVVADYAGFAKRVMHLAGGLQNRFGIGPGDRVALFLANRVEYLELFYAIWFAGAVAVPINQKLHAKEAAWIVGDAEAKVVFVDDDGGEGLVPLLKDTVGHERAVVVGSADFEALRRSEAPGMPVPRHRDDLAWLFYTSGTTGKPKGVMLSNGNLHAMAFSYFVDVDGVLPNDAALYAASL